MKTKLFLFTFLFVSAASARFFNCSAVSTQHEVLRVQLNNSDNLIAIAEIAQMPFSSGQMTGEFVNVTGKVKKEKSGTQSVWFADHYTERISLILNIKSKKAQIEVFDTDDWRITRTEDLTCDFDGYYERN